MTRSVFLLCILFLSSHILFGQEWIKLQNKGVNFEDIKLAMSEKFEGKSTLKGDPNYDKSFKKYARWEYYWRFQLDNKGEFVSPNQMQKSFGEIENNSNLKSVASWSFVGQSTIPTASAPAYAGMGRINCFAFDPSNTNEIWVGAANGGLWKSNNGGTNWTSIGGNLPVLGISDIAVSANGNTVYIATGDADGQHSTSVGIMKSTDGGMSFLPTGYTHNTNNNSSAMFQCHHLWIHPTNSNIVIATSTINTQRTTDGGTTWTVVDPFASSDIKMKPNDPTTLYIGAENEVIKSTDGGVNWNVVRTLAGATKIDLAVSGSTVYAISDNGVGARSTNNGTNWSVMNLPNTYDTQGSYNQCIAADPSNPNRLLLGGVNGWVSTNGGNTWAEQLNGVWQNSGDPGRYVHSDHHMVEFLPGSSNVQLFAHDGGIHKGNFFNLSATWTDLSEDLDITQYYGMDGFPSDESILIAGAQDQDGVWHDGTVWTNINNNSDGTGGQINHTNSNISFCKSQSGLCNKTTNAWITFNPVGPSNADADFVWPLEMDHTDPQILYGGYDDVYKTTNGGTTWSNTTNQNGTDFYTSIAISTSNPSVVYSVRDNSTIFRSTNAGSTWTMLSSPFAGQKITNIEVSLSNSATAYLTYGGYTTNRKIYMTTNSGSSWTNISTGIPNVPVFCVAEQASSGDLYIGTQFGVYHKTANGTAWAACNTGLPPVSVYDLNVYQANNTLRAATFGRGIWKASLDSNPCPSFLNLTGINTGGDHESSGTITSTQTIAANAIVDYDSATEILLDPGFETTLMAVFHAFIDGCDGSMVKEDSTEEGR